MKSENLPVIKTDFILDRLVQPRDKTTLSSMKTELLNHSENTTIQIWNGCHLGDGEKYNLCKALGLDVYFDDKSSLSHDQAGSLLCSEQLNRKDLTNEYRKYLIGQKFLFEEQVYLSTKPEKVNARSRIAYQIGADIDIIGNTVLKYSVYATAMNYVFDESKEFAMRILLGKTRVSHKNMVELSRLAGNELRNIAVSVLEENTSHLTFSEIRHEVKYRHTQTRSPVSRREREEQKERKIAGIRQMPVHDPDAEVNSLSMTLNSWIASIERVNHSTDFVNVSSRAKLELMKQLTIMQGSIRNIQKSLVERCSR